MSGLYTDLCTTKPDDMLATKVLAHGITHLTDARYFAAWEVDYLAFPLGNNTTPSIDWAYFEALREWVEGPVMVADLGAIDEPESWTPHLAEHRLNHALVHHPAPADTANIFTQAGITLLLYLPIEGYHSIDDLEEALQVGADAGAMVLDFEQGGITLADLEAGHPFGLPALGNLLQQYPCLLQIDLGDVAPLALKETHGLLGYAVRGSSEEKVGYKSFDDLDVLFEGLEILV